MTFRCDDLRENGLILVPNTSPEYDPLLEDIQRRIENSPPGMPANLHRSGKAFHIRNPAQSIRQDDRLVRSRLAL